MDHLFLDHMSSEYYISGFLNGFCNPLFHVNIQCIHAAAQHCLYCAFFDF